MWALERQSKIIDLLQKYGSVKVSELSGLFNVTEKTVREDLEKMAQKGLLTKIHGGALLENQGEEGLLPLTIPNVRHLAEKAEIAGKALECIEENDIVALDAGSTTLELAKAMPNRSLTVITNDLYIIRELLSKPLIRLVVPGGYQHHNLLVGDQMIDFVQRLNVRKVFLSTTAIHLEFGLSIFTGDLVGQKKAWLQCASAVYCLCDHSKFDKSALITFAQLTDVHRIITDGGLSDEMYRKYTAAGVEIWRG